MEKREGGEAINLSMLSLFQYLFAILVILLHSNRVFEEDGLHFLFKSIAGRMAVPFFLISASFFWRKMQDQKEKRSLSIKRLFSLYLFWSLLYLPYAYFYFQSLPLPLVYFPLGLVVAFFYTGTCYQLWYIPAYLLGLFLVQISLKKLGSRWTWIGAGFLYLLGSVETYSAYLQGTAILETYEVYATIFFTTRNGLFYTPIFILCGYFLYEQYAHPVLTRAVYQKLLLSSLLLGVEGYLIFQHQGKDKNFFLALIPFSLFFFNAIAKSNWFRQKDWFYLKRLSFYYYFLHPIFIELTSMLLLTYGLMPHEKGRIVFASSLLGTHLVSALLIHYQDRKRKRRGKREARIF